MFVSILVVQLLFAPPPAADAVPTNRVTAIVKMNAGITAFEKGDLEAAKTSMAEAIVADGTYGPAHLALGQLLRRKGELIPAERVLMTGLAVRGTEAAVVSDLAYELGRVRAAEADLAPSHADKNLLRTAAVEAFNQAAASDPTSFMAHFRKAEQLEALDDPGAADDAYRECVRVEPRYTPCLVSLGLMYLDYGQTNAGMGILEKATEERTLDARAWLGFGKAALRVGRPADAVSAFQKVKAIDPDLPEAWFGLGMAHAKLRERKEALEALEVFVRRAGASPADVAIANDTIARLNGVI